SMLTAISIYGNTSAADPVRLAAAPAWLNGPDADPVIADAVRRRFRWPGHTPSREIRKTLLNDREQEQFVAGRRLYLTTCSGCHGTDGAGLPRFGPTLIGSDWVLGDERRLALILLHGMEGPVEVKGKLYDQPEILPVMPSHSILGDGEIKI